MLIHFTFWILYSIGFNWWKWLRNCVRHDPEIRVVYKGCGISSCAVVLFFHVFALGFKASQWKVSKWPDVHSQMSRNHTVAWYAGGMKLCLAFPPGTINWWKPWIADTPAWRLVGMMQSWRQTFYIFLRLVSALFAKCIEYVENMLRNHEQSTSASSQVKPSEAKDFCRHVVDPLGRDAGCSVYWNAALALEIPVCEDFCNRALESDRRYRREEATRQAKTNQFNTIHIISYHLLVFFQLFLILFLCWGRDFGLGCPSATAGHWLADVDLGSTRWGLESQAPSKAIKHVCILRHIFYIFLYCLYIGLKCIQNVEVLSYQGPPQMIFKAILPLDSILSHQMPSLFWHQNWCW